MDNQPTGIGYNILYNGIHSEFDYSQYIVGSDTDWQLKARCSYCVRMRIDNCVRYMVLCSYCVA